MTTALHGEELAKTYPGASRPALAGLELSIAAGEVFGLLGPNGAGKTTTISILSTVLRPDRGKLTLFGIDALRSPSRVREMIGLVPQDVALFGSLSARENLRYFGRLYGLWGRELESRIDSCLDLVGLTDRGEHRIDTYSGGMKRRANLAAGLVHRPRLLFLDEPTVGIDAQSRTLILDRLTALGRQGMAMVYSTHYMEEAEGLCSRVAILDAGRVLLDGEPSRLIADTEGAESLGELFLMRTGRSLRD